jgi:phospholipid/cholesterol/gamma-HCH transport system substrate-binding protein
VSSRKNDIFVGLFVVVALLILIFVVVWGKETRIAAQKIRVVAHFEDVYGLDEGDPVMVRGIKHGNVKALKLQPDYAEVVLELDQKVILYSDAKAVIESRELLGGKQVTLHTGHSGEVLGSNKILKGEVQGNIGLLMSQIGQVIIRADSLLDDIRLLIADKPWSGVFNRVEETSQQARDAIKENRKTIRLTLQKMENLMEAIEQDSLVPRLGVAITHLDSSILLLNQVASRLKRDEGTMGLLLNDRKLYDQLVKTSQDLDSLVTDIKANPKKYIRVSVF